EARGCRRRRRGHVAGRRLHADGDRARRRGARRRARAPRGVDARRVAPRRGQSGRRLQGADETPHSRYGGGGRGGRVNPVMVVARRELGAMFRAPLAYVFLVLFLVVAQLPHVMTVFLIGQVQANQFFDWLPWFIVVFAALVTMRSWAEERQDNTYEMLLTFPMKDRQLVLGKW